MFPSDEFYLTGGAQIPVGGGGTTASRSGRTGIGMVRTLLDDWKRLRRRLREGRIALPERLPARVTLACGSLIAPTLTRLGAEAGEQLGMQIDVVSVSNTLFGARR